MNNPLGVSPSKGKRNHTRQRKNLLTSVGIEPRTSRLDHDLQIRSTVTLPTELQDRTEKVGDDFLCARSKDFFFASCGSLFPFTRANAQWVIHGFK